MEQLTGRRLKSGKRNIMASSSLLALAACGGGGGGGSINNNTGNNTPAPQPDFTESPTNTFTARDNNNRTLSQSSATADLIVEGRGGNDTINTGAGADTIDGGGGGDTITSRAGADIITGGDGDDTINAGDDSDLILAGNGADDECRSWRRHYRGDRKHCCIQLFRQRYFLTRRQRSRPVQPDLNSGSG